MPVCIKCSSEITQGFNFCPNCGQPTKSITDQTYDYARNPYLFENRVAQITPSVIAFAAGTFKDGTPRIIGTGFGVDAGNSEEKTNVFATCSHVMDEISSLKEMGKEELEKEGLIDKERRIAVFQNNACKYEKIDDLWIVEMEHRSDVRTRNLVRDEDICICAIKEVEVAPLHLSPLAIGGSHLGSEVGVIGFPVSENLQRKQVHPCVLKTIISSQTMYPFLRDDGEVVSPRLVLGCMLASGFSGGPVFSVETGDVLGMVDYLPIEEDIGNVKIIKPTPIEGDVYIRQPAGISFAIPSFLMDFILRVSRKSKWETPGQPRTFKVVMSDADGKSLDLEKIDDGDS